LKAAVNKPLIGLYLAFATETTPLLPTLDEQNGGDWIAVVENEYRENVCFTAIDHCIELRRSDGTMMSRCDGMLSYSDTLILVELKVRNVPGNAWIVDGDLQLRSTIEAFERTEEAQGFVSKKAYIANKARPVFRNSQMQRMEIFKKETGYTLRIVNRIKID
jgi:hypothetical protein